MRYCLVPGNWHNWTSLRFSSFFYDLMTSQFEMFPPRLPSLSPRESDGRDYDPPPNFGKYLKAKNLDLDIDIVSMTPWDVYTQYLAGGAVSCLLSDYTKWKHKFQSSYESCTRSSVTWLEWLHSRGETKKITNALSLSNGKLSIFRSREFGKICFSWISSLDSKIFPAILAWSGLAGPGICRLRGDQSDSGMISLRLPIYSWPLSRTISQHLPPHTSHLSPPTDP